MKKLILLLAVITSGGSLFANSGIFATSTALNVNGQGTSFYGMLLPGDNRLASQSGTFGTNGSTDALNLGTFNTALGNSLLLVGGENATFKNGSDDINSGTLNYNVHLIGAGQGSFTGVNLPYNTELGGGDQRWKSTSASNNLLSGLSNGSYLLEVFSTANFTYSGGSGTHYASNNANNYTAKFTVVPEPSSLSMLIGSSALGSLFLIRRRRA